MKTKNEIVDRLYKAGHVSLEEVLVLCEEDKELPALRQRIKDLIKPQPVNPYVQPVNPWRQPYSPLTPPYTITCSNDTKIGENSCLTVSQLKGEV
jgi:hypothetical protein